MVRYVFEKADFQKHSQSLTEFFLQRGYSNTLLGKVFEDVKKMNRSDLLEDKPKHETKKDPQSVFVCTWHPKLSKLPSILHKNFAIIQSDADLSKIYTDSPSVAFRRKKNISNFIIKTDTINKPKSNQSTSPCGNCKTCPLINQEQSITNFHTNITIPAISGGNCRTRGLVYAVRCKKHNLIYIGHTGDPLKDRISKHKYDIHKRPDNNELATHFHKNHNFNKDLDVMILQSGINTPQERLFIEDRFEEQKLSRFLTLFAEVESIL